MKKIFFLAAAALMSFSAMATDLWTGNHHVTWETSLQLTADKFASAQVGNELVVTFTGASDGIELKVMNEHFDHLAGSRNAAWIEGDGSHTVVLTYVDALKQYGLEIIGNNFNVTKVELNAGEELAEGTIWKGFFWMDNWSTLELYADAYKHIDLSKVKAIYFNSEAKHTNYILNFRTSWEEDGFIANQDNMEVTLGGAKLVVTDDIRTKLADAGVIMIQCNKETGDAFNFTSVVFEIEGPTSLNDAISTSNKSVKRIVNGQLVIERDGVRYNALGTSL